MTTDTGGPAFPCDLTSYDAEVQLKHGGMTLRDYAAIKAMQSLMTNFLARELNEVDPNGWMEGLAMDSYSMADAMMKERKA